MCFTGDTRDTIFLNKVWNLTQMIIKLKGAQKYSHFGSKIKLKPKKLSS